MRRIMTIVFFGLNNIYFEHRAVIFLSFTIYGSALYLYIVVGEQLVMTITII